MKKDLILEWKNAIPLYEVSVGAFNRNGKFDALGVLLDLCTKKSNVDVIGVGEAFRFRWKSNELTPEAKNIEIQTEFGCGFNYYGTFAPTAKLVELLALDEEFVENLCETDSKDEIIKLLESKFVET